MGSRVPNRGRRCGEVDGLRPVDSIIGASCPPRSDGQKKETHFASKLQLREHDGVVAQETMDLGDDVQHGIAKSYGG